MQLCFGQMLKFDMYDLQYKVENKKINKSFYKIYLS
jgi:hypothetical protein